MLSRIRKAGRVLYVLSVLANIGWLSAVGWISFTSGQFVLTSVALVGAVGWLMVLVYYIDQKAQEYIEKNGGENQKV